MKRFISMILTVVILLMLVTGCSDQQKPDETPAGNLALSESLTELVKDQADELTQFEDTVYLSLNASAPGGSFYTIAAAYIPFWEEALNVTVTVMPGGSAENYKAISNGTTELGFTHHTINYMGANQLGSFDQEYVGVCSIAPFFPVCVYVMTLAGSPVKDLSQLGNANVGFGAIGSTGNEFILNFLDEEYGITPESIVANGGAVSYLAESEIASALSDGQVDAITLFGVCPKPNIAELEQTPGLAMIQLDAEKLLHFLGNHPQWASYTIPAGTIKGQMEDINSVAAYTIISCQAGLDEELVYGLTRVIWEYKDEAASVSSEIANYTTLDAVSTIANAAPLHPGAERYYREIGLIK